MAKKFKFRWLLLALLLVGIAYGVGSYTETVVVGPRSGVRKLTLAWTSDFSGDVNTTTSTKFDDGEILRVVTIPGTSSSQPTDDYDVTIEDSDDADILLGAGANRDQTVTEQIVPILNNGSATLSNFGRMFCIGPLELKVANAGSTNTGSVIIYWR